MTQFTPIGGHMPELWEGKQNFLIRIWVYLKNGLDILTEARYWIFGIYGGYAFIKLEYGELVHLWILPLMFILTTPVLVAMGRWKIYRAMKPQEFMERTKGSVLGYKEYNLHIENLETLKKVLTVLSEK